MATSRAKNKNNMLYKDTRSGFTIIEVVLVLAIAGLIFLMVFIALPQLQRAQRDTQRRNDIIKLQSAIENYKGNNNGRLPDGSCLVGSGIDKTDNPKLGDVLKSSSTNRNNACRLIREYMGDNNDDSINLFVDPDGDPYGIKITNFDNMGTMPDTMDYVMHMVTGAECDGELPVKSNNSRDFVIVYRLEGSGVYCHGNNG